MKFCVKYLALSALLLSGGQSLASSTPDCCEYPILPQHAQTLDSLVPTGWRIEEQDDGNFRGDPRDAVVLFLRSTNPNYVQQDPGLNDRKIDTNPRILVIAFKSRDGTYELALQNHTLLPRPPDERDYEYDADLELKRGVLRIGLDANYSVGPNLSSSHTFTFQYKAGRFELIGFDYKVTTYDGRQFIGSLNYLTRRKSGGHASGCIGGEEDLAEIAKNCRVKPIWSDLPSRPLLKIEDIQDGLEWSPEDLPR